MTPVALGSLVLMSGRFLPQNHGSIVCYQRMVELGWMMCMWGQLTDGQIREVGKDDCRW